MIPIFIPYVALVFLFFRRFLISAIAFLAAAFISPAQIHASRRVTPYTATDLWHAVLNWVNSNALVIIAGAFVLCWIFVSWIRGRWGQYQLFSVAWIIGAAVILIPIIAPIYPIPNAVSFYVAELRQPWLPEEKITLTTGQVDYGYTLTTNNNWFEILTAGSRTIRYIPARYVGGRDVCQQTESFSPLIPLPRTTYVSPTFCLNRDGPSPPIIGAPVPRTRPVSYLSHGESLNVISSSTHVAPEAILSETNAYQHQRLSFALHKYEACMNWNAPTPYGQHFWYYPPTIP